MNLETNERLLAIGLVLLMLVYWTYYILVVRRVPESESWYDAGDEHGADRNGALFMFPYGTLFMGVAGIMMLVDSLGLPEFSRHVLRVPLGATLIIATIGFTGGFGIPLPWPFVPRWVVEIRRAKRARARKLREAKKAQRKS